MAHPVDVHVGKQIKRMRALRRMSQTDLAQSLNTSFQRIQKYEIGSNRVSASLLHRLSGIFGVSPCYFFAGLPAEDDPGERQGVPLDVALGYITERSLLQDILQRIETELRSEPR